MCLKNNTDYKRFPEPSRGDRTRFTILVLSAEIPYRAFCEGFFVKSGHQKVPKIENLRQKKLLAAGQLSVKDVKEEVLRLFQIIHTKGKNPHL